MTDLGALLISILCFNFVLPWLIVDMTYRPMGKVGGLVSIFPLWLIKVVALVAGNQLWIAGNNGFWLAWSIAVLCLCLMVHIGARVLIGLKTNRLHALWLTLGPPAVIIWFLFQMVAKVPLIIDTKSNLDNDDGGGFEPEPSPPSLEERYPHAFMAIEYRPEVRAGWEKVQTYDMTAKNHFLRSFESNPKLEVDALLQHVTRSFEARIHPFQDDELNAAYEEAFGISEAAASEFKEVIDTLGYAVNAKEVLKKIKSKHEIPKTFWMPPMG